MSQAGFGKLSSPRSPCYQSTHQSTHCWSYRVPSPPRITVPPPQLSPTGAPDLSIDQPCSLGYDSIDFPDVDFLHIVTYGNFISKTNMLDWKYEWRREAQKVLPFMYLGPVSAARDRDFLKREGVTMLLAVRDTKSAHARLLNSSNVADEIGIEFEAVDVAGNQELIAAFPYAIQLVNKHLTEVYNRSLPSPSRGTNGELRAAKTKPSTGKVLVYCESGNERSAGVVAAYIMAMYDVDIIKALQVVQAQRFCVCFDDPMKNLLDSYAAILQAKRDVARAKALSKDKNTAPGQIRSATKSTGGKSPNKRGKRSLDEAYETDLEMGDAYGQIDEDRFGQRAGFAPFEDW